MAERSFKEEVEKLKLGEGDEFHGEGILAVTKALLQSGVSYVAGYQGAPISHLMDVLADANEILEGLGVHFENSASEATAAATLAASVNYPLRGAVTFKSTVGTNVASDALANLASGGVTGGAGVPPALVERADAQGIRIVRSYGSTEHPTVSGGHADDSLRQRSMTDGRLTPGTLLRIVDEDGRELPPKAYRHAFLAVTTYCAPSGNQASNRSMTLRNVSRGGTNMR